MLISEYFVILIDYAAFKCKKSKQQWLNICSGGMNPKGQQL